MDLFETQKSLLELKTLESNLKSMQYCIKHPLEDAGYNFLEWLRRIFVIGSIGFFIFIFVWRYKQDFGWSGQNLFQKIGAFFDVIITSLIIEVFIIALLLAVYYFAKLIVCVINAIRNHGRKAQEQRQIYLEKQDSIKSHWEKIREELKTSQVPMNYRNLDAVNWMIRAFNDKRGSTYAELINLYDQHQNNERKTAEINNLQHENQELKMQLQQANAEILRAKKDAETARCDASSARSSANWAAVEYHLRK